MKAIIMGLIGVFIFTAFAAAEQKQIKPEITTAMRNKGLSFYNRLVKMRKEREFKQYGFDGLKQSGQHEKYQKWMWDAYDLQNACSEESRKIENVADRLQSELSRVCIAINNMNQMGQHYARNKGQDDEFTLKVGVEVRSALKVGQNR